MRRSRPRSATCSPRSPPPGRPTGWSARSLAGGSRCRAYGGAWAGQLRWGRLTHARAAGILQNPVYAGAYVFGRRRSRQVVDPDGTVHSSVTELPRDQWEVLIPDHHEGYITWAAYLANEAKLAANHTNAGARPPREGTALCQGIMFCGGCGKLDAGPLPDRYPRYECSHSRADHVATPLCGSVARRHHR